MVEWNRIFLLFRFSGILGQPREVLPKFRNEIPGNVCSVRSQPGISGIFGQMESALRQLKCVMHDSVHKPAFTQNKQAKSKQTK